MNRELAQAIAATFREDAGHGMRARLATFDGREWLRIRRWLHTSGLALPLFARLQALSMSDVLPEALARDLEQSTMQNRARTEELFREFVKINVELQRTQLCYANLKGFTLVPRACADPALRYQHDIDILVARSDAAECRKAVERLGYRISAMHGDAWEFRAGPLEMTTLRDLYKAQRQRSLEIHLVPERETGQPSPWGDRLARLQLQTWEGFEFPALSECDKLLGQARHVFHHLKSEWTRTAWMLEYANAVRSYRGDEAFWSEAVKAVEAAPQTRVSIGVATLVAGNAFSLAPDAQFLAATVDQVPPRARLWVDLYADEMIFLEHPGSKLYLLLQQALEPAGPELRRRQRSKLLPLHLPPNMAMIAPRAGLRLRAVAAVVQTRFVWGRICFHVLEGLRYRREAARWRRLTADRGFTQVRTAEKADRKGWSL